MSLITSRSANRFKEKYGPWAIVAGASEGLGAAYAEALACRQINLVLVARRLPLLKDLADSLTGQHGIQVRTVALDLAEPNAANSICREADGLDIRLLVYNAAYSAVGAFIGRGLDDHLQEVDTNIRTPMSLVHHFGGKMLNTGHGGIILMTSLSAFQGSAYISNYSATKAYNLVLAESLWEEWRGEGVDVLACIAGAVRTPNYEASLPRRTGRFSDATMEPSAVVEEALQALGRQPTVIPGRVNRLSSFIMRRLLPRRTAIRMMGSVLRGMYVENLLTKEVKQ